MIPFSIVAGQDKKSEQKIKIVVDDGSGTKVVVDTVFNDNPKPDSIKLKDGTVIFLKHNGEETDLEHHTGKDQFVVTYSVNSNPDGKEVKEVTIVSSDSLRLKKAGNSHDAIIYSYSNEGRAGEKYRVITRDSDGSADKSRYVIAKDGIVVTVEGTDEIKTKALVKEIESQLGVKSEGTDKKETVKVESKKAIKN